MSVNPQTVVDALRRVWREGYFDLTGILVKMCPADVVIDATCSMTTYHNDFTGDNVMKWELSDEVLVKLCNQYISVSKLDIPNELIVRMGPNHPAMPFINVTANLLFHAPEVFDIILAQPESDVKWEQVSTHFHDMLQLTLSLNSTDKLKLLLDYMMQHGYSEKKISKELQRWFACINNPSTFHFISETYEIVPDFLGAQLDIYMDFCLAEIDSENEPDWRESLFAHALEYWHQKGMVKERWLPLFATRVTHYITDNKSTANDILISMYDKITCDSLNSKLSWCIIELTNSINYEDGIEENPVVLHLLDQGAKTECILDCASIPDEVRDKLYQLLTYNQIERSV